MAQRIFLSLLLAFFWTIAGCDSSDPEGETGPSVLLPLDEGNQWVMAFTRTNDEGEVTESYTDTLRVVGDTTIAGERWAELRGSTQFADGILGGFYTNREDGVWKWNDPTSDSSTPLLLYKYPAEAGDSYPDPCCSDATTTVTVLSTDTSIDTPAGTLSAYHYEFDTDEVNGHPISEGAARLDRYLVPGQGFASIDCAYVGPDGSGSEELVRRVTLSWRLVAFETP